MECVKIEINNVDTSSCLKPCSGLIVTSFSKTDKNNDLENLFPVFTDYNNFKRITPIPTIATGNKDKGKS